MKTGVGISILYILYVEELMTPITRDAFKFQILSCVLRAYLSRQAGYSKLVSQGFLHEAAVRGCAWCYQHAPILIISA